MKPSSFKIPSVHFLQCVFLILLWGVTASSSTTSTPHTTLAATLSTTPTTIPTTKPPPENVKSVNVMRQNETSITLTWDKVDDIKTYFLLYDNKEDTINVSHPDTSITHVVTPLTAGTKYNFTLITTFGGVNSSGHSFEAVTAPRNTDEFKSIERNETSITLQWEKVDDILDYILVFNGSEINVTASEALEVTHTILELRSGTKYDFILLTVFENVRSSGFNITAVTAPENVKFVNVTTQNETSITLTWDKVDDISTYFLLYDNKEDTINVSHPDTSITHVVTPLTAGTKYNFTLITAFEGVNSTGRRFEAVTAPRNTDKFKSIGENETSITLQWKKVDDILDYILVFNGSEINVTASEGPEVMHTILKLRSGTKYDFILLTVFENVRSSGVNITAVTAPRNTDEFKSIEQNETSITLQWEKVDNILHYILVFNGSEINVTASEALEVTHTILELRSGTKYDLTLLTVFENVRSSGFNITAVTAPENVKFVNVMRQNETSITLTWDKVDDIKTYFLLYDNKEDTINVSHPDTSITHVVTPLTAGTKYQFTLITVFEGVNSSGYSFEAVTAPRNADGLQSIDRNETSITLQWKKVDDILDYILVFNGSEINVTASEGPEVMHTILKLRSGTKYDFILLTVFENVRSSGVNITAVTAPRNTDEFKSIEQNETCITLQWEKVDNILHYILVFNGSEINVTASEALEVTHTILELRSGTKYDLTLLTVFENVRSSGFNITAVTAPENVKFVNVTRQNETSITLMWDKVDDIKTYFLLYDNKEDTISVSHPDTSITHVVTPLTAGTKYQFTLITVFEGVNSSGYSFEAVTAPRNADGLQSIDRNETSITLQWKKVDDILDYILVFNGSEINVTASEGLEVMHTILKLRSGTKYDFILLTVFENVRSSGVNITAVTAPRNTDEFKSIEQNETSITLQWEKVDNILHYILVFNGSEINVTASEALEVTHTILELRSGTKYDLTLLTVFENVRSSGFNITAVTAPENVKSVNVMRQNETSITLTWDKVDDIKTYFLLYDNKEDTINVSHPDTSITHVVTPLTAGTKYNFTLITVFEGVNSSGYSFEAVTAPRNSDKFKSIEQNETSITLQWEKVDNILNYILVFNGCEINVTASEALEVTHTILELRSGTKYDFILMTVFENVRSSGFNITAVTAPGNVNNVTVSKQNETSITLMWNKVDNISTYFLEYTINGSSIKVKTDYQEASVTHEVSSLNAGTKYNFTLITQFEKVNSTGFSFNAVTAPSMVDGVSVTDRSVTSITLTWQREKIDWDYFVEINEEYSQLLQTDKTMDDVSHTITPLQPGTEYNFSVITSFAEVNSTAYNSFTVTAINCTTATWQVTTSSIHGMIEGLFTSAYATNTSQIHESDGGSDVSFTGLYPGATYTVSLEYEKNNKSFHQCSHTLTTFPPHLTAECKYAGSGYSVSIVWDKPYGMWAAVEVNVTGKIYTVLEDEGLVISGFQPARTYEVSVASLSGSVRSNEPCVFSCLTDPRGVIAGAVCAVLFFCILVCLAVFIFLRRPDIISRKKSFIGNSRKVNKKCKAISVTKFPDHFHQLGVDENRGFSEEYESLFSVGTEQTRTAALSPQNKVKNRFSNVLPYDWCRVKLSGTPDYINASYMPGYNSSREYIATQGPLPSTVNDFWRMIWEQRVRGIIMLTNCIEGGRAKCEQYWPAGDKPCSYGELLVTIRSEQKEPNWTWREFSVKHSNTSEERTVNHFHFTAWPDHGVPQGTEVLIQFRGLVRRHMEEEGAGAPTVVHCSAGVGRTGTIIALDVLLQQLEKERAVGINAFVHKMRLSRPHMVQTESQYIFLHQSIMDCLQQNKTTEENIYENADMIYANATVLREFR